MSGPKVGSGAGSGIPASDRKLVSSLKEIVPNSEEEIYAMLKECNRDPDETAQRLLSEGKFHVVRRKRDKKKESASNKESSDARSRPSSLGPSGRNTRTNGASGRGVARGSSLPRLPTNDVSGGRGRIPARLNGIPPSIKGLSSASTSSSYSQPAIQPEVSTTETISSPLPSSSSHLNGGSLHSAPPSNLQGAWLTDSGLSTPTILQGAWLAGSGHPTMADVLKSSGACSVNPLVSTPASVSVSSSVAASTPQPLQPVPPVSGVYLAASDPVLSPSLDPRARSSAGVVKREIGTVGNQRSIGDRLSSFELPEGNVDMSTHSHYSQLPQTNNTNVVFAPDGNGNSGVLQSTNSSVSPTPSLKEQLEGVKSLGVFPGSEDHLLGLVESSRISAESPSQAQVLGSQFTTIPMYQAQQFTGNQKVMDWNSEPSTDHEVSFLETHEAPSVSVVLNGPSSSPPSASGDTGMISATATKLQELIMRDDQPVIIPDHLRVSEADCTRLSFGSFDSGFETFPSSFTLETKSTSVKVGSSTIENEAAAVSQPSTLSMPSSNSNTLDYHQRHLSGSVEILDRSDDSTVSSNPIVSQSELTKPDAASQHSLQFSPTSSYRGVNLVPPNHTGQYAIESESRSQDTSRLSSVLQPYSDPTATYYSGVFRSGPEIATRYSTFLPSSVGGRYVTGGSVGTGQNAPLQESVLSSSNPLGQTLQSPTAVTVPQRSLSVHAYAAQPSALPMGPFANVFSYQYVPPGFSYLQSPYQHNYTGTGSYQQVPPVGAATVKYPVPQYKPGGTVGTGMHNAVATGTIGYGGFSNSQPGNYAVNPPATIANAAGFDDIASQYKDNNLYIPGQQVEGSAMWLQAQLSREIPGVQGNSYHNIPAQNQQTRLSQTQSLHAHSHLGGAYGSLYHPQQSGVSPSSHQSLQSPQVMGPGSGPGTQVESYQQGQRGHQSWTNGF